MGMFTDPNRVRADIPGRVEGNPVFGSKRAHEEASRTLEMMKEAMGIRSPV